MTEKLSRISWPTVVVVLGLATAAVVAAVFGQSELGIALGSGGIGYLGRGAAK